MKIDFRSLIANPAVKTVAAVAAGAAVATVDAAVSNPTGGALDWAHAHPITFFIGSLFVHNLISRYAPPPAPK
ncbi:MAG: hypothetical protein JWO85_2573 [Candidatus Eremiobacteraeota bacterium]|nr:hypothetical protein [Candidatus Eremiobacteraeota bacterium]